MNDDRCAWAGCRQPGDHLRYIGKNLCQWHWMMFCRLNELGRAQEARRKVGLAPQKKPEAKRDKCDVC